MTKKAAHPLYSFLTKVLLLLIPLLLASPRQAYGYADPGSGAFVYQAVYAAFLGGAYYFRRVLNYLWPKRNK
jgi:hypothetical protein